MASSYFTRQEHEVNFLLNFALNFFIDGNRGFLNFWAFTLSIFQVADLTIIVIEIIAILGFYFGFEIETLFLFMGTNCSMKC